jgi:hypothetical protein
MRLENVHVRTAIRINTMSLTAHKIDHVRTPATVGAAPGRGQKPVRHLTVVDRIEEWRPIAGFEASHEVSNLGRVRSIDRWTVAKDGRRTFRRGRLLTLTTHKRGGYWVAVLNYPGVEKKATVHRLVCRAFNGEPFEGAVVRHLNGDPKDNRPENLKWGTCAENTADIIRHGRNHWLNKTECKYGHKFTDANTRRVITPTGGQIRNCRECARIRSIPKNKLRDERNYAARPTLTCQVCQSTFRHKQPKTRVCSAACKRISRRKEFGWNRSEGGWSGTRHERLERLAEIRDAS